jgi:hypothetical protein
MKSNSKKILIAVVAVLALSLAAFSLAAAKQGGNSGKTAKKAEKVKEFKNFEKAAEGKGIRTNAQIHREKIKEAVTNIKEVAEEEKAAGNEEVSQDINEVVNQEEQTDDNVAGSIEKVETKNKWKILLAGTDYKNLGQLRSALVHNRNQIRKLTQSMTQMQDPTTQAELETQITTLMQERERIKTVIQQSEDKFSILGWVFKFLYGYKETPVDDQEEQEFINDVSDSLTNGSPATEAGTLPETGTDTGTDTGVPTNPMPGIE